MTALRATCAALGVAAFVSAVACGTETFVSADAGVDASSPTDAGVSGLDVDVDAKDGDVDDAGPCGAALFCQSFDDSKLAGDGFSFVSATAGGDSVIRLDQVKFVSPPKALSVDVPVGDNGDYFVAKELAITGAAAVTLSFSCRLSDFPSGPGSSTGLVRLELGSDTTSAFLEVASDGTVTFKEVTPTHAVSGPKLVKGTWTPVSVTLDVAGGKGSFTVGKETTKVQLTSLLPSNRISRLDVGPFWVPHTERPFTVTYDDVVLRH